MLFLFESPLESRFLNIKQVVNLTLPRAIGRLKCTLVLQNKKYKNPKNKN